MADGGNRRPVVVILLGKYKDEDKEIIGVHSDEKMAAEKLKRAMQILNEALDQKNDEPEKARLAIANSLSYEEPDGTCKYWTELWRVE